MFDWITRPLAALMMMLRFKVRWGYAYKALDLQSRLEAGKITERAFMQAGEQLGEQYPEDFKRLRNLFVEGPKP